MRSINSVMKLFSNGNSSPIEREVRRRLTWRIILLSLFPLPFLSLIIIWLCCLIQLNAGSIDTLLNQNCKITSRLCSIENELRKLKEAGVCPLCFSGMALHYDDFKRAFCDHIRRE